jgi:alpha/beta superfamily hydrolase
MTSCCLLSFAVACADSAVAPEQKFTPVAGEENVYIISTDSVVLNGRLFGGDSDTVVILTHMRPNDQRAWFDFAEELADEGYAALTFNFRGYDTSGGDKDDGKLDDDLRAAIRYMRDRGMERVYLVGASIGATTALVVAAEEEVQAVVAISPPAEFEEQDALTAVTNVTEPKLFIASEGDEEALRFTELVGAAGSPKEEETYSGNEHGTALFEGEHAGAVRERVLSFLEENGGP